MTSGNLLVGGDGAGDGVPEDVMHSIRNPKVPDLTGSFWRKGPYD